jgi:hypothetical protein
MSSEEIDDDDDGDQVQYWNESGEDSDSIIPMYVDWMKGSEYSEGNTDVETISEKSFMCNYCGQELVNRNVQTLSRHCPDIVQTLSRHCPGQYCPTKV